MRGCALTFGCLGLFLGYAAAGTGIVATLVHFAHEANLAGRVGAILTPDKDGLARELARCQQMGIGASDDPRCQAAWAENRRRFFDYGSAVSTPQSAPRAPASPNDRPVP